MEELKFRAWDLIKGKMCLVTRIDWIQKNVVLSYGKPFTEEHEEYERFLHDVILMQYIGRKDDDGKKIYEGDIVKHSGDSEQDYWKDKIDLVKWNKDSTGFYPLTINNKWRHDINNIKVIGNKYENPNLLKEVI